jgi:hypothetical protein
MRGTKHALLLAVLASGTVAAPGCSDQRQYYFVGRIYDGVTGARLNKYQIELQYLDRRVKGTVDTDGRYFLGPLGPYQDYTIAILADGYRSFLSHNAMLPDSSPKVDQSQYFDAYLYPVSVVSPAATLHVTLADSDQAPSGSIRFRPTTHSSLFSDPVQMPAGVGMQVWDNDDDLQFATVSRDFTDGTVQLAEGDLIFGVKYAVTIYGVKDHQETNAAYTAGVNGDAAIVVKALSQTPLALSFVSTQLGVPVANGELVFVFNQPVEFDPLKTQGDYLTSLEANFSIDSPDANMNMIVNTLKPFDPKAAPGSRGLSMTLMANKLTLNWAPGTALMTTDPADPIRSVTYGGLDGVVLRPVNGPSGTSASVATLLGAPSLTVPVSP